MAMGVGNSRYWQKTFLTDHEVSHKDKTIIKGVQDSNPVTDRLLQSQSVSTQCGSNQTSVSVAL